MPKFLLQPPATDSLGCLKRPFGKWTYMQQIEFRLNGYICFPKCIRGKPSSSENVFIKDLKWGGKQ